MNTDKQKPLYYLNNDGKFYQLGWISTETPVYLDELNKKIIELDELNAKIRVITQKYARYRKCRKPKMFNTEQTEQIKKRRKEGASLRQIAKEMKCSEGTIRNYLKMGTKSPNP